MKKVVIVNAGGRLSLSAGKGDYDNIVESLLRQIDGFESSNHCDVVNSVEAARGLLNITDVVIFVTAGLLSEARRIKQSHPRIRVIVLTGLIPEDEVILLSKLWLTPDLIRDAVMGL